MKLRLLGTGAADGIPALCGHSPVSDYARKHGGKDMRTRSAAVLDDAIKIDFGPDTLAQVQREHLDTADWSAVVFTHSDDDHLACSEIQYFLFPFNLNDLLPFTLYGNGEVLRKIEERYPAWPLELVETHGYEPFSHAGYEVTPVLANHGNGEEAHNLVFARDGKTLIYATDTGMWCDKNFEFLAGRQADALVIECTDGLHDSMWDGHLNLETCLEMVARMSSVGAIRQDAQIVTTHHSHLGGRHCDLARALGRHGITVGYDGLEIEI